MKEEKKEFREEREKRGKRKGGKGRKKESKQVSKVAGEHGTKRAWQQGRMASKSRGRAWNVLGVLVHCFINTVFKVILMFVFSSF